jgi:hypothetical protein
MAQQVYRIVLTSKHDTAEERDKAYVALKESIGSTLKSSAIFSSCELAKDEYTQPTPVISEKVI